MSPRVLGINPQHSQSTIMKCRTCESETRAVCENHAKTVKYATGFGQKLKEHLWPSGSETEIIVHDAICCGACTIEYQCTW